MRRIALILSIAFAIAIPASVSPNLLASAQEAPPITPPPTVTTVPYHSTTTTAPSPYQRYHQVKDEYKVTAWGEVATSKNGAATLVAKQSIAGPTPGTRQITFDLCAVREFRLSDTGMVSTLGLLQNYSEPDPGSPPKPPTTKTESLGNLTTDPVSPLGDVLIDNTGTVVKMDGDGNYVRVLEAPNCVNVTVTTSEANLTSVHLGFVWYDSYSSRWKPEGGFARLMPNGPETQLVYSRWVSNKAPCGAPEGPQECRFEGVPGD